MNTPSASSIPGEAESLPLPSSVEDDGKGKDLWVEGNANDAVTASLAGERDEWRKRCASLRERLEFIEVEHAIAQARLRGEVHPDDNGDWHGQINIPSLLRENQELREENERLTAKALQARVLQAEETDVAFREGWLRACVFYVDIDACDPEHECSKACETRVVDRARARSVQGSGVHASQAPSDSEAQAKVPPLSATGELREKANESADAATQTPLGPITQVPPA